MFDCIDCGQILVQLENDRCVWCEDEIEQLEAFFELDY